MARWLVNRNDVQMSAESMAELKAWAEQGKLGAGDLIQPPGASDWLYAGEVAELAAAFPSSGGRDDDLDMPRSSGAGTWVMAAVFAAIIGVGGYYAATFYDPGTADSGRLSRMSFSEMIVTGDGVAVLGAPEATAPAVGTAPSGTVFEMLAKRGEFYKARAAKPALEGWVDVDKVMPMYLLGGGDVMKEFDPLYNPDRYLDVANASWMQLPEQRDQDITTVFQFMLRNDSAYDMTDLLMVARIKDSKGHELEQVEFRVQGIVPADGSTMVGTLVDPESDERRLVTQWSFEQLAEEDPDLQLEYNDGVEVKMETEDVTDASIDIIELRAIPKGEPAG